MEDHTVICRVGYKVRSFIRAPMNLTAAWNYVPLFRAEPLNSKTCVLKGFHLKIMWLLDQHVSFPYVASIFLSETICPERLFLKTNTLLFYPCSFVERFFYL